MADDLEKAVMFSFDHTGAVDAALKAQAMAFLDNARAQPAVWQLCVERFSSCGYAEVKFWCLQTLHEAVRTQHAALPADEQQRIRMAVAQWLTVDAVNMQSPLPPFVKNKLIQIVVELLRLDYPQQWPTFFHDMMAMLGQGAAMADVWCRVLVALDEEIISLDIPRTNEELAVSMRIKDAMRESCIRLVVDSVQQLVVTHQAAAAEVAGQLLQALARYVSWIGIELVATERMLPLLMSALQCPAPSMRIGATSCLTAMVNKRMERPAKLRLVSQLGLVQLAVQLGYAVDDDDDVVSAVAALLAALMHELVGTLLARADAKEPDASVDVEAVSALVDQLLPPVLARLQSDDADVSGTMLTQVNNLVRYLQKLHDGSGGLPVPAQEQLRRILLAVARRCRLPDGLDFDSGVDREAAEAEAEADELRRELLTVFRNVSRLVPTAAVDMLTAAMAAATNMADVAFQEMEVMLFLLGALGVGLSDDALNAGLQGNGDAAALVALVVSLLERASALPGGMHRLVTINLMEVVVRFVRVLQQRPQYISNVLAAFLGPQGLQHPNRLVSGRASYLFMRLVKALRGQLGPYMEMVMNHLVAALPIVLSTTVKTVNPNPLKANNASSDDHLYVLEAAGLLVGFEEAKLDLQSAYLQALLSPLRQVNVASMQRVEVALAACAPGDTLGPAHITDDIQLSIVAIGHLSKGFSPTLVNTTHPALGTALLEALETALAALRQLPGNRGVRARVTSLVHRMVDCMAVRSFPVLPAALPLLLASPEVSDLSAVLTLINQLASKFKTGMEEMLTGVLEAIFLRVDSVLQRPNAAAAVENTEEQRELHELKHNYNLLLNTFANVGLLKLLRTAVARQRLEAILEGLCVDAVQHAHPAMCKTCVCTLRLIVAEWCDGAVEQAATELCLPGWGAFAMQRVGRDVAVRSAFAGELNLKDAVSAVAFKELSALQHLLCQRCGPPFLECTAMELTQMGFPPAVVQQYAQYLQGANEGLVKGYAKQMRTEQRKAMAGR